MPKYIIKHVVKKTFVNQQRPVEKEPVVVDKPKHIVNNTEKKKKMKQSSITNIESLVNQMGPEQTTKRIKKDKGLIERMESEKIMITEDNRQLLND